MFVNTTNFAPKNTNLFFYQKFPQIRPPSRPFQKSSISIWVLFAALTCIVEIKKGPVFKNLVYNESSTFKISNLSQIICHPSTFNFRFTHSMTDMKLRNFRGFVQSQVVLQQ